MSTAPQEALASADQLPKMQRRIRRLWVSFSILALVVAVLAGDFVWRTRVLSAQLEDLRFSEAIDDDSRVTDYITPTVNTIQFLHKGYSVSFDTVQYTQDGLVLGGEIGNGTNLWVSSLAVNFAARQYPYKVRDQWAKDPWFFYSSAYDIGKAQTSVGDLNPGGTASFHVTIPDVKQGSEDIHIAVSFSGERYQYRGGTWRRGMDQRAISGSAGMDTLSFRR